MALWRNWQHSLSMLLVIILVGGITLMMGQHTRSESLFYYFRLEAQVPDNHLLRLVDKHINFGFVRERLKESYSDWASIHRSGALVAHLADRLFTRRQQ